MIQTENIKDYDGAYVQKGMDHAYPIRYSWEYAEKNSKRKKSAANMRI
jgi:hypothetical protein